MIYSEQNILPPPPKHAHTQTERRICSLVHCQGSIEMSEKNISWKYCYISLFVKVFLFLWNLCHFTTNVILQKKKKNSWKCVYKFKVCLSWNKIFVQKIVKVWSTFVNITYRFRKIMRYEAELHGISIFYDTCASVHCSMLKIEPELLCSVSQNIDKSRIVQGWRNIYECHQVYRIKHRLDLREKINFVL